MKLFDFPISRTQVLLQHGVLLCVAVLSFSFLNAQGNIGSQMVGAWVINDDLSDNSDDQVEEAIEAGGGDGGRGFFNRREDFYRGGPPEHELYDRLTYDDVLSIEFSEPEFRFTYEDNYIRVFHTDGRRRRTTANDFFEGGGSDWSEGNIEVEALVVEARPRDGGFATEIYTLENDGNRLRIEMLIQPLSFREPIELVRYYDRVE
ncbi:MAG: hypothetical protein GKR91_10830 [Pseudomonadales bacterium]|nr:hypothetical protein [Pseudomonadales bacterium]